MGNPCGSMDMAFLCFYHYHYWQRETRITNPLVPFMVSVSKLARLSEILFGTMGECLKTSPN
jgi:hypothetical protein